MDLGSIKESSTVYNFASTETKKFYDMWEGNPKTCYKIL